MRAVTFGFLVLSSLCFASSEPPPPSIGKGVQQKQAEAAQSKQEPQSEQRGTASSPVFVQSIPSAESEAERHHKEYEHNEKPTLERLMGWGTLALAVFTALLFVFTALLWGATSRLVQGAKDSAQIIERAYIRLKEKPPGLVQPGGPLLSFSAVFIVENCGNTPCEITDLHVYMIHRPKDDPLPLVPDAEKGNQPPLRVFLTAGDHFDFSPSGFSVAISDIVKVRDGSLDIYVIGHVDYRDSFDIRRRTGYARRYIHSDDTSKHNLQFVTQSGYNYDRARQPGEGDDWS